MTRSLGRQSSSNPRVSRTRPLPSSEGEVQSATTLGSPSIPYRRRNEPQRQTSGERQRFQALGFSRRINLNDLLASSFFEARQLGVGFFPASSWDCRVASSAPLNVAFFPSSHPAAPLTIPLAAPAPADAHFSYGPNTYPRDSGFDVL